MIGLAIYVVMFVIMLIGGIAYLREQPEKSDANDVFWMIMISLFWFVMIPLGLAIGACQGMANLINKGKDK